jgi:hypothetical protein
MGVYLMGVHLMGAYLMGAYLMGVYLMGVYLMGVYLMGVHLIGVHLMSVYLINVYLTGVYLMSVHLMGVQACRPHRACISEFRILKILVFGKSSLYPTVGRGEPGLYRGIQLDSLSAAYIIRVNGYVPYLT